MLGWLEAADESARRAAATSPGSEAALREASEAIEVALSRARRAYRIARRAIELPASDGAESLSLRGELLGPIIDEGRRGLLHEARRAGVEVVARVDEVAATAPVAAGERLLQVVTNLVLNAIAVTPAGAAISVVATCDPPSAHGATARIEVTDGGPGIPEADRPRLFQRGASGRPGGAGIGLAHAQALAIEEGGLITVRPFAPGTGACFELSWPLHEGAPVTSPRTIRPAHLDGLRVAVLEDDAAIVELLDTVLVARGATVAPAASVAALRQLLAARDVQVALVDASPLGAALEDVLRSLKTDFPETDLVLISGSTDPGVAAERLAITWIRKPFEVSEVVEVLRLFRGSSRPGT